jgi:hypothetical protein
MQYQALTSTDQTMSKPMKTLISCHNFAADLFHPQVYPQFLWKGF